MKKFSAAILLGLAGLGLAGCSGSATNTVATNANSRTDTMVSNANSNQAVVINSNAGTTGSSTSTTDAVSGMTAPNGFMMEAARGGMAEVELSKLATTKAQNPEVKKFAQQMIQDHTNANTELKQLAGKKNVTLPT